MGSVSHHPERYRQSNQRLCYVHDSTWGSQVMLDPLEHTWSRSDLMCREGRALKTPRCCRGHSTVFDSTDDILYTIYYILYTLYYVLYTINYILYTIYYILCTIYYI